MTAKRYNANYSIQDELQTLRSRTTRYYIIMFDRNGECSPRWITKEGAYVASPFGSKIRFETIYEAWSHVTDIPFYSLLNDLDVYIVHERRALKIQTFSCGDPAATYMLPRIWIKPQLEVEI